MVTYHDNEAAEYERDHVASFVSAIVDCDSAYEKYTYQAHFRHYKDHSKQKTCGSDLCASGLVILTSRDEALIPLGHHPEP